VDAAPARARPATPGRPDHLPALDGLRAVAVAVVVAYHLGRLRGGFIGVDLFFVLSGFLITRLLLAERSATGRISLRAFWARRVRRLMPAMAVTAAGVLVAARHAYPSWRLADLRADALAALAYVANWRFITSGQSYFESAVGPSPFRHAWSLAVEEQYYIVWPILVAGVLVAARHRRRLAVAATALAVTALSAGWLAVGSARGYDQSRLYFGTDTRLFALTVGALVATWFDPVRDRLRARPRGRAVGLGLDALGALGVAAVVAGCTIADQQGDWMYRWGFLAVALASALALAGLGLGTGPASAVLAWRPLRWIGERSYGIYLYSWPIQQLAAERRPGAHGARFDLAVMAVTLVAATLSFALLERPIVTGRPPWRRRAAVDAAAGAASGAATDAPAAAAAGVHRPAGVRPAWVLGGTVVAAIVVVAAAVGGAPKPTYLTVDDEEVAARALETNGFGGAPTTSGRTTTTERPAVVDGVLPPGDDPPFDPRDDRVVTGGDRDPASIFGRPLRITLFGDSVPSSLTWDVGGLLEVPIQVSNHAILGCSLMPWDGRMEVRPGELRTYLPVCEQQAEAERAGIEAGPDVVVLWSGAWEVFDQYPATGGHLVTGSDEYARVLRSRIQLRVDLARDAGIPTVLVLTPCFGNHPDVDAAPRTPEAVEWFDDQVRAVAARNPGWARLVDPSEVLCPGGEYRRTLDDGSPLRHDGIHFVAESAAWFWNTWFASAIASTFPA